MQFGSWGWVNEAELRARILADILDEERTISVILQEPPYPSVAIDNVEAPESALEDEIFTIGVNMRNDGEAGPCWITINDADTGDIITPRATFPMVAGGTYRFAQDARMINRNYNILIRVGHVED